MRCFVVEGFTCHHQAIQDILVVLEVLENIAVEINRETINEAQHAQSSRSEIDEWSSTHWISNDSSMSGAGLPLKEGSRKVGLIRSNPARIEVIRSDARSHTLQGSFNPGDHSLEVGNRGNITNPPFYRRCKAKWQMEDMNSRILDSREVSYSITGIAKKGMLLMS